MYSEPNQIPKMELSPKILNEFQSITIFTNSPKFDWVFNTPLCSEDLDNYFQQIYLKCNRLQSVRQI